MSKGIRKSLDIVSFIEVLLQWFPENTSVS